jgi:sorting nexin-8
MEQNLVKFSIFDVNALEAEFAQAGIKQKHAATAYRYVLKYRKFNFEQLKDFPVDAIKLLKERFGVLTKVVDKKESADGSTTKLVILLSDGVSKVECVVMRYGHVELRSYPEVERKKRLQLLEETELRLGNDAASVMSVSTTPTAFRKFKSKMRATVCVSTQVGCAMGCKFCAVSQIGLMGNLTAAEVLEQVYHARGMADIRNVVYMANGEPLMNYENLRQAVKCMVDPGMFGLSPAKITISTVGVVPKIWQMLEDMPQVSLALSLHAPDQETREKIVPTAKTWKIKDLMDAVSSFAKQQNEIINSENLIQSLNSPSYQISSRLVDEKKDSNKKRRVLLEYVLLGPDVNCTEDHAHKMGKLIAGNTDFLLNVIPYNPTAIGDLQGYKPPTQDVVNNFVSIVRSYDTKVTVRQELGQDINAACGQLIVAPEGNKGCDSNAADIEDMGIKNGQTSKPLAGKIKPATRRRKINAKVSPIITDQKELKLKVRSNKPKKLFILVSILMFVFMLRVLWKLMVYSVDTNLLKMFQ